MFVRSVKEQIQKTTIANARMHTHNITTKASSTGSAGSTLSFTNPLYITVYMWKRVS